MPNSFPMWRRTFDLCHEFSMCNKSIRISDGSCFKQNNFSCFAITFNTRRWQYSHPTVETTIRMPIFKLDTFFYKPPNLLYAFCRHRFWVYFKHWVYKEHSLFTCTYSIMFNQICFFCAVTPCSKSGRNETNWATSNSNNSRVVRGNSWCVWYGQLQFWCVRRAQLQERVSIQPISNSRWLQA